MQGMHGRIVVCAVLNPTGVLNHSGCIMLIIQIQCAAATLLPQSDVTKVRHRYHHAALSPKHDSTIIESGAPFLSVDSIGTMMHPHVTFELEYHAKNCANYCSHTTCDAKSVALAVASKPQHVAGKSPEAKNCHPDSFIT
jgi:hypothetical protein